MNQDGSNNDPSNSFSSRRHLKTDEAVQSAHHLDASIAYLAWKIAQKERLLAAQRADLARLIAQREHDLT